MSDIEIEQEPKAKGKTALRITPDYIESVITEECYINPPDDIRNYNELSVDGQKALAVLTICILVLNNGFIVTGESACASPEDFDKEIGRKVARRNAVNKIWELEGYLLKQRLAEL